jgi:hypothetical protein
MHKIMDDTINAQNNMHVSNKYYPSHCTPKLKAPIISHNDHKFFWVQANPKTNSNKEVKKMQSCDHSMLYK